MVSPTAVAVVPKNDPPADLRVCAERPKPLPEDQVAVLPASLRLGLITLARAFGANADRLDRLVNWHDPDAGCGKAKR